MDSTHDRGTRRRTVFAAVLAAGLFAPIAPATADTAAVAGDAHGTAETCHAVPLPLPAGTTSTVKGGDLTGRYLVGQVDYSDRRVGALWQDGLLTEIDASSIPNAQVDYHDVNRYGVVVGERMTDFSSFHTDAFVYRAGTFTFLPALVPGDSTEALGINSRGDVVGNSVGADGWRPVVWPANAPGTVRALPFPATHTGDGRAVGIDEDGSVVGVLSPYPPGTPYLWPTKGKARPLPVPADSIGGSTVAIQGGMVAGNVFASDGRTRPALWNLRTGPFTLHEVVLTGAVSVNGRGTIGGGGVIVHADGHVSPPLGNSAIVNTVADNGVAAGATAEFNGQATRWVGC